MITRKEAEEFFSGDLLGISCYVPSRETSKFFEPIEGTGVSKRAFIYLLPLIEDDCSVDWLLEGLVIVKWFYKDLLGALEDQRKRLQWFWVSRPVQQAIGGAQ